MAITIELNDGQRITIEKNMATIGRGPGADIVVKSPELQPIHATISQVSEKWMVESAGDWLIQVSDGIPGRKQWLQPDQVLRLTESGVRVVFEPVVRTQPNSRSSREDMVTIARKEGGVIHSTSHDTPPPLPSGEQELKRAARDFSKAAMATVPSMLAYIFRKRQLLILGIVVGMANRSTILV